MANNTLTAKEFLEKLDQQSAGTWVEDDRDIIKAFKEFAEMHLEEFSDHIVYEQDGIWQAYAYKNI